MSITLKKYFSQFTNEPSPTDGFRVLESQIFSIGSLDIQGSHLFFCDPWGMPNDGAAVDVPPGQYDVSLEVFSYGTDGRVARLIVNLLGTTPIRGEERGGIGVDVASAAVYDGEAIERFMDDDEKAWQEWLDSFTNRDYDPEDIAGFFPCPKANSTMAYTSTGFGDGYYLVYELVQEGLVVGAEVVFLKPNQGYFEFDECNDAQLV